MASELIHRNQASQTQKPNMESLRPADFQAKASNSIRYLLRERVMFVLIGIAIDTLFFNSFPQTTIDSGVHQTELPLPTRRVLYEETNLHANNAGGKMPLGLKTKSLRVVVTGGAGFVGSHLVDRLIARGDSVVVVDNFFTGRKENLYHHFGNPKFELIRHDVVEPILLEVDQIYHLACPASPVHYKYNPVKTIISFSRDSKIQTFCLKYTHIQSWGPKERRSWAISPFLLLFYPLGICVVFMCVR